MRTWTIAALSGLTLLAASGVAAEGFPSKPVRVLVGVPAGAGPDIEARLIAGELAKQLGQPVIVENRPGAAQVLAMEALAKSPADGYTIGMGQIANLAANPRLFGRRDFDVDRDLAAVSLSIRHPWLLYVNAGVPARNLAELIALARTKPDSITYASTGVGSFQHLSMAWLESLAGVRLKHVPYGANPWVNDVVAGNVDAVMFPLVNMVDHLRSGKVRALAISNGGKRSPLVPDVAQFEEQHFAQFQASAWAGVVVPAGTPKEAIQILGAASAKAARSPAFRAFADNLGATAVGSTPPEFASFLAEERKRWKSVIDEAGIRLE